MRTHAPTPSPTIVKMEQREVEWFEVAGLSIGRTQPFIQGCRQLRELGAANNGSPLRPPEGARPGQHLDLTCDPHLGLGASRTVKVQSSIALSHKFVVTFFFCTAAQEATTGVRIHYAIRLTQNCSLGRSSLSHCSALSLGHSRVWARFWTRFCSVSPFVPIPTPHCLNACTYHRLVSGTGSSPILFFIVVFYRNGLSFASPYKF